MSECVENLKSVPKNRILACTTRTNPLRYLSQEIILRNPQALYISRNIEKIETSKKKLQLFIKLVQISNDYKQKYERAKSPVDFISHMVRRVPKHQDCAKSSSKIYFISKRSKTCASFFIRGSKDRETDESTTLKAECFYHFSFLHQN